MLRSGTQWATRGLNLPPHKKNLLVLVGVGALRKHITETRKRRRKRAEAVIRWGLRALGRAL